MPWSVEMQMDGSGEMSIPMDQVPGFKDAARHLSDRFGVRLNFAHAHFLYASAINAGALESVGGEWEGQCDDPNIIEAIFDFVESCGGRSFLDDMLAEPGPNAAEKLLGEQPPPSDET